MSDWNKTIQHLTDEAARAQELAPDEAFEKDCWKAMRRLLDECHFSWRDLDPGEGISADDAEEHIKTTLDELEKDAVRQRARATAAEAALADARTALESIIRDLQEWVDAVEQDSSWDGWDQHYKAAASNLPHYRAALSGESTP